MAVQATFQSMVAGYRRYAEKSQQARVEVEDTLRTQSGKVTDIPSGRKRLVLGYKRSRATTAPSYVALLRSNNRRQLPSNCLWCVGNPGARKVTRLVRRRLRVGHGQIRENNLLASSRWRFQALGSGDWDRPGQGIPVEGRPQGFLEPDPGRCRPRPQRLATLQALAEKGQQHQAQLEAEQRAREQSRRLEAPAPNPKDTKKALDLPSGEYLCRRYASMTFRGAPRTLFFLVSAGEDGEPATDVETPTYGHDQGQVAVIGGIEALQKAHVPLLCYLGAERTIPQKKKDRLAALETVRIANAV